jgi:hypothetical protein
MTCARCGKKFAESESRCPHCGTANAKTGGMFQTSTVMISTGGSEQVYRSVDEVPGPLRTRLLKSTNGANSATILIADRRGRKEIAKAMRKMPANAQRRLMQSILAGDPQPDGVLGWFSPVKRRAILAAVALLALAAIGLVFTRL